MAAPILPSLLRSPPLLPHQPLYFPPSSTWSLPPPPVQFYSAEYPGPAQFMQPRPPHVNIGAANFLHGPGPGFRGRGGYHQHRGGVHVRGGRGRGGIKRGGGPGAPNVEKKSQKPAQFSCKVCNKEYRCEESYHIHLQSHQKVCV